MRVRIDVLGGISCGGGGGSVIRRVRRCATCDRPGEPGFPLSAGVRRTCRDSEGRERGGRIPLWGGGWGKEAMADF